MGPTHACMKGHMATPLAHEHSTTTTGELSQEKVGILLSWKKEDEERQSCLPLIKRRDLLKIKIRLFSQFYHMPFLS